MQEAGMKAIGYKFRIIYATRDIDMVPFLINVERLSSIRRCFLQAVPNTNGFFNMVGYITNIALPNDMRRL
jgi:hypothetical protein